MKITFKYDSKSKQLQVISEEKKYRPLEHLGHRWTLQDIQGIKAHVELAKNDETLEDFTIDGQTGFIWIYPDSKSANVYDLFSKDEILEPLLKLTLDEVVEFLGLMENFLKKIK